jgi:hypothetical protein
MSRDALQLRGATANQLVDHLARSLGTDIRNYGIIMGPAKKTHFVPKTEHPNRKPEMCKTG